MSQYYNRYENFLINGNQTVVPFLQLPQRASDQKYIYRSGQSRLDKISFEKYGAPAIVLGRFVPVVRPVITGVAGVARMNFRVYAIYSTIGGILWATTLTLAGYYFGNIPAVKDNIEYVLMGFVLLTLIPAAYAFVRQLLKKSKA